MRLECTAFAGGNCGVGTRILAPKAPRAAALTSASRRWLPRVSRGNDPQHSLSCAEIADKADCCAAVGNDGDVCVPAVTAFADGATCAGWNALQQAGLAAADLVAACPPNVDPKTQAARPRTKLTEGAACSTMSDRVACCSATDGRGSSSGHENAPCIPAVTAYANGAVCESASHVFASEVVAPPPPPTMDLIAAFGQAQSAASCAELGAHEPLATAFGEEASVTHEVHRLTLAQAAPAKLTQRITFTALDCPAGADCVGGASRYVLKHSLGDCAAGYLRRVHASSIHACADACIADTECGYFSHGAGTCSVYSAAAGCPVDASIPYRKAYQIAVPTEEPTAPLRGAVTLRHGGKESKPLGLKSSRAQIAAAFAPIRDGTISEISVASIATTNSTVVWTVELTTPWAACGAQPGPPPRLSVGAAAKVLIETTMDAGSSCLVGGVDLSLPGGESPSVFLPWDATEDAATSALRTLLADSDDVHVARGGDGHATASFTIRFLHGGARPLLHAASSASRPLAKLTYAADYLSSTSSADVSVFIERLASGAIELLPIPGRYLSAPSDQPAVHLRLGGRSTARCAAPHWSGLLVGCVGANNTFADAYAGRAGGAAVFANGFSLERCALHCSGAAAAVAFAAVLDVCTCLSAATLVAAQAHAAPAANCSATCSAEDEAHGSQLCGNAAPYAAASVYSLPSS